MEKVQKTITEQLDDIVTKMCDDYCKFPALCKSQKELDKVCENCPLERI